MYSSLSLHLQAEKKNFTWLQHQKNKTVLYSPDVLFKFRRLGLNVFVAFEVNRDPATDTLGPLDSSACL